MSATNMRTYRAIRTAKVSKWIALRKLIARLVVAGAACGAAAFCWIQLTTAQSLAIKTIHVEGTGAERAEEVRALLNVKPGDNILFADLTLARARAESHPWVARAAVKREIPDTLRIVVEERTPALILALDRLYYVDAAGEPFKLLAPGDTYDMPVLSGLTRDDLLARADTARAAIAGAIELLGSFAAKESPLKPAEISEIVWDEDEGYSVVAVSGRQTVRFGRGGYAEKLARLSEVRAASPKGEAHAAEIDLTYSSRVIVAR